MKMEELMNFISQKQTQTFIIWGLKLTLAAAFLSAVADRFGMWGASGSSGVAWGNMDSFIGYTAILNPWAPKFLIPSIGWLATILEICSAILLLTPFKTKEIAFLSGILLFLFGSSMAITGGLKGVLDYSVFSASFAAFALSLISSFIETTRQAKNA